MNQVMSISILETIRGRRNNDYEEFFMLILVADKRSRIRFALRLLIEQATGHTIVAEVADAESLTTKIRETLPDLVLLEWELSKENNGRLISSLKEDHPQINLVVLSGRPNARKAALKAGADDFVSKVDPPDRLLMILNSYK
jgi:DNA-binding NarL/FixJ family response regulator